MYLFAMYRYQVHVTLSFLAASFGIPGSLRVSEDINELVVCAQMTPTPPDAILGMNVVINLSTEDKSGM